MQKLFLILQNERATEAEKDDAIIDLADYDDPTAEEQFVLIIVKVLKNS